MAYPGNEIERKPRANRVFLLYLLYGGGAGYQQL